MKPFKIGQKVFAVLEFRQVIECTVAGVVPGTPVYVVNIDTNSTAEVALTNSQLFTSELKAWEFVEAFVKNQIANAENRKKVIESEISTLEAKLVNVENKLTVLRPATGASVALEKIAKPKREKPKVITLSPTEVKVVRLNTKEGEEK